MTNDFKLFINKHKNYFIYGDVYCVDCNEEIPEHAIININRKRVKAICEKCVGKDRYRDIIEEFLTATVIDFIDRDFTLIIPQKPFLKNADNATVWDVDSIDKKYGSSDKDVDKTCLAGRSQELISMKEEPKQVLIGEYKGEELKVGKDVKERIEELDKPVDDIDSLISKFKNEKEVEIIKPYKQDEVKGNV